MAFQLPKSDTLSHLQVICHQSKSYDGLTPKYFLSGYVWLCNTGSCRVTIWMSQDYLEDNAKQDWFFSSQDKKKIDLRPLSWPPYIKWTNWWEQAPTLAQLLWFYSDIGNSPATVKSLEMLFGVWLAFEGHM